MRASKSRIVVASIAGLTILACGGDQFGMFLNQLFFGVPHNEDVIALLLSGNRAQLNNGAIALLPPGSTATVGTPVCYVPANSVLFKNAWKLGTSDLSLTNLVSGVGGNLSASLLQDGNDLKLDTALAIPPGRWSWKIEGNYSLKSQEVGKSLSARRLAYEFDVFNSGFSNIPLTFGGDLPANSGSQTGLEFKGTLPANNGQGPAYLDLTPAGGAQVTYTGSKALGATEWTIQSNQAISVPATGYDEIRVRVNF